MGGLNEGDKSVKTFYEPTPEHLTRLAVPWSASFSGGKDSSSLVTWVEWLRRADWITIDKPSLVQADTGVEDVNLQSIADDMRAVLTNSGWDCVVVRPAIHERLYNRILGIGNTPIHPGTTRMRWCTRSTKTDPMDRYRERETAADEIALTGLRLGESTMRDGKIKKHGCAAGGECGIPDASERTYSPILTWTTCQVVDWLTGMVSKDVMRTMRDVFKVTKRLVDIYNVKIDANTFDGFEPDVTASRFGCIGCPAIQAGRHAPRSSILQHGADSPLNEIYDVWFEARRREHRCWKWRDKWSGTANYGFGPIKMAVRKVLFERVMDIQRRAGIVLVTPDDEAFIRECWATKRYPRGWSEADELTVPPSQEPLFDGLADEVNQ